MTTPIREQPVPANAAEIPRWLAQFQVGVLAALRALASVRIVQGAHLTDVELAIGANTIAHKLNRQPRGWILTRQSVVLGVYETDAQLNERSDRFLSLTATAAGSCDLWVF
jgi:hypothetical protein